MLEKIERLEKLEKDHFAAGVLIERIDKEKNPFNTIPDVKKLAYMQHQIHREIIELLRVATNGK